MLSVNKYTNVLDDKKESVVTTPLSKNKLLKTEKVTTSDELHKSTDKIKKGEEFVEYTDEVHKHSDNITTNEEGDKGTEKLEDMK